MASTERDGNSRRMRLGGDRQELDEIRTAKILTIQELGGGWGQLVRRSRGRQPLPAEHARRLMSASIAVTFLHYA